ncbi:hypothetical protein H4R35_005461 [Dimargaris xerosporica]|nr:hypothetical protein H4R35_005461 [Dimargaris xerosporica]
MAPAKPRALTTQQGICSRMIHLITSQFTDPAKRPGNASIAFGTTVFAVTVIFLKKFGDLLAA